MAVVAWTSCLWRVDSGYVFGGCRRKRRGYHFVNLYVDILLFCLHCSQSKTAKVQPLLKLFLEMPSCFPLCFDNGLKVSLTYSFWQY
jgi:hypothetical protein